MTPSTNMAATVDRTAQLQAYIMHHVTDSHEWVLPFLRVPLPGISLHGLMLLLGSFFLLVVFGVLYRKKDPVPHGLTNALEAFVVFIRDQICIPNLGDHAGRKLTPLFCTFFFFIFTLNLMGMIPLFVPATGNLGVTAALASLILLFMIGGSIYQNGLIGFIKCFAPPGVPWPILIILVPLEFIGMFTKAFALTIRLFANMLAGHIVIFSLLGLMYLFGAVALPALALAAGVYVLELMIAFLQAFIFTLLSSIFVGQLLQPAH